MSAGLRAQFQTQIESFPTKVGGGVGWIVRVIGNECAIGKIAGRTTIWRRKKRKKNLRLAVEQQCESFEKETEFSSGKTLKVCRVPA